MTATYSARLPQSEAEAISAALDAPLEAIGVTHSLFENDGSWEVTVYVEPMTDTRVQETLATVVPDRTFERTELPDDDWVTRSLSALAPVRAGRFIVHGSHDCKAPHAGETAIRIDAARAFGTGHHGTTAGCLVAIDDYLKRRPVHRAIDVGTGSGVLAIALAKRSRRRIVATDIDPVATGIARENARINGVGPLVRTVTAAGLDHAGIATRAPFDLIVANILAGPLRAMAPSLARHRSSGGTVILSGLLERQRASVVSAYRAQGLRLRRTILREGWATLILD